VGEQEASSTGGAVGYRHVDVFADAPFRGNGLIVVFAATAELAAEQLRVVTEEMRQFETIFVAPVGDTATVQARIFTVEEELPFAGHPVIGAAAALHERLASDAEEVEWQFRIQDRPLRVISRRDDVYFDATMDQGSPAVSEPLPERREEVARALGLRLDDLAPLPLQVISTGLPYLIVPVTPAALGSAHIGTGGFESMLDTLGAKFVYVLDVEHGEGRTWDNIGAVEDVATGSAAGPAAAYLHLHRMADPAQPLRLAQGRFVGRPSSITVTRSADGHLWVGGPVRPVAAGSFDAFPARPAS
jgi:trans-2,3-dihydro-3-hydroxyanthranilate isomerase